MNPPYRVFRGGCFRYFVWYCRTVYRNFDTPDYHITTLGFRLVRKT